jgi:hypothetical protein
MRGGVSPRCRSTIHTPASWGEHRRGGERPWLHHYTIPIPSFSFLKSMIFYRAKKFKEKIPAPPCLGEALRREPITLLRSPIEIWIDSNLISSVPFYRYFICSSIQSASTRASIASATGTIRGTMQGSCLPPTEISTTSP